MVVWSCSGGNEATADTHHQLSDCSLLNMYMVSDDKIIIMGHHQLVVLFVHSIYCFFNLSDPCQASSTNKIRDRFVIIA